jgi:hypothetical protein
MAPEQEPPVGSHLTSTRRGYCHLAIGHAVRITGHPKSPYSPEEVVRRARSRPGENDYRLLTNNCEHFCNWCLNGVSHSAQVQRPLRLPFRVLNALFQM